MAPVVPTPNVPINFVHAKAGEIINLGKIKLRVMEDGSRTDNRLSAVEITIPPHTPGPPPHWHEMHDETFLVTQGTARFHVPAVEGREATVVDASVGGYVVVPTRAPHTFSNETDEECRIFNTFTPAFYIHYFKLLESLIEDGKAMTPELNVQAMAYYATIPVQKPE